MFRFSREHLTSLIVGGLAAASLVGCSAVGVQPTSSPTLYPNDHYRSVGVEQARRDVRQCMWMADEYVNEPNRYGEVAKETAKGAVVGTAAGAVGGSVFSNAGRGAGAGAAIGAIVGLASELNKMGERSPSYQRFAEHCLQKQGYEVIGWE